MVDLGDRLGRRVTVHLPGERHVLTATVTEVSRVELLLTFLGREATSLPPIGGMVSCVGSAGLWEARVLGARPGSLSLQTPTWLRRPSARRSVRVKTFVPVSVIATDRPVAGRIADLSVTGAAILLEGSLAPPLAASIRIDTPSGPLRAVVRSRRSHEHPLLRVLGLEWEHPEGPMQRWLHDQVARDAQAMTRLDAAASRR